MKVYADGEFVYPSTCKVAMAPNGALVISEEVLIDTGTERKERMVAMYAPGMWDKVEVE